jgi:hypothetical protein
LALVWLGGCSGGSGSSAGCDSYCEDLCAALDGCGKPTEASCASRCSSGIGSSCRGARPADQLTCAEAERVESCAAYCAALCDRAPDCGSFDPALCRAGCAEEGPQICNPASVGARSCDVLKPELRLYEEMARAAQNGGEVISNSSGPRFGLCKSSDDCEDALGCSVETSTCAPCQADGDCANDFGSYVCAEDHTCQEVGCLVDDDCSSGICDAKLHECGDCRVESDCDGLRATCDVSISKCVECIADANCANAALGPRCSPVEHRCVACLSNSDCKEPYSSRCDTELGGYCRSCEVDADCTHTGLPICDSIECVECTKDEHCSDPDKPKCDTLFDRCAAE